MRSFFRADPGLERAFFVCAGGELVALWPLVVENAPRVPGAVDLPVLEALRSARGVEDLASPGQWAALWWVLEAVLSRSALVLGGAVLRFGSAADFVAAVRDVLDAGSGCGCSVLPGLRLVDLCCLVFPRIEVVRSGSAWDLGFVLAGGVRAVPPGFGWGLIPPVGAFGEWCAVFWRGVDPAPPAVVAVQFAFLGWLWLAGRLTPGVLLAVLAGGAALSFVSGLAEELWVRWRRGPGRCGSARGG